MNDDIDVTLINKIISNTEYYAELKINEGAYAQIYKVVHKQKKKTYALKVMQICKLQKFDKMHEAVMEMLILKKLSHPGIIKFYHSLRKDNYICLLLELCPYGDVYMLIKNVNRNIQLAQKKNKIMVYYLAQILQVIDYMHIKQIIHRDIKPQNIVIGEDLRIRFIDFATSKTLSDDILTNQEQNQLNSIKNDPQNISDRKKSFVGSANYLSPEGLKLEYSQKNDIWAFGVIAYKFYYNHLPFQGSDNIQIFKKISENEITLEGKVDPGIQQLLVITLKKDPNHRPTAKMLKLCTIFKDINFKDIFVTEPPIFKEQFKNQAVQDSAEFLFEVPLQKKMFFGNFKQRLLTISKINGRLFMAYRYIPSKIIKREFQLNLNDYAQIIKNDQFQIVTTFKKYCFRVKNGHQPVEIVNKINTVIKKAFNLE